MRARIGTVLVLLASLTLPLTGRAGPPVEGAVLVSGDAGADGPHAASQSTALEIRGIAGNILVRGNAAAEVKCSSTTLGEKPRKLPVELWSAGATLYLVAPEGEVPERRRLEVAVPASMAVRIEASDSKVAASGIRSGLQVRGGGLTVDASDVAGGLGVQANEGQLAIQGIGGDVTIEGQSLKGQVSDVQGTVHLRAQGSNLRILKAAKDLDAQVEATELMLEAVTGPVQVGAQAGGKIVVRSLVAGGKLRASGTPIVLSSCRGDLEIESDADIQLNNVQSALRVDGFGGSLKGSGIHGTLDIRMTGGSVALDTIAGDARVQGENVKLRFHKVTGSLLVNASSSDLLIENAHGPVTVLSEVGDVVVRGATDAVDIESRSGTVRVLNLQGSVDVRADGELVEVTWGTPAPPRDSSVSNTGGKVVMTFQPMSAARVDARSGTGRIETSIGGIEIAPDGKTASGSLGQAGATILIDSGGDVHLSMKEAKTPAAKPR